MSDIEKRLVDEADGLESLRVSTQRELAFREQLLNTHQQRGERGRRDVEHRGWWLSGLVVASLAIAFFIRQPTPPDEQPAPALSVTPSPDDVGPFDRRSFGELTKLQQVSRATALEEEWDNIRKDLEQARQTIEEDLPIRF